MRFSCVLGFAWLLVISDIPYGVSRRGGKDGGGDDHGGDSVSTGGTTSSTADTITPMSSVSPPSSSIPPSIPSSTPLNATMSSPGLGLQFAVPDNTTTCDSITFFWTPTGGLHESPISLVVTNQGLPEHLASTVIMQTLSESLSTDDQHFTWLHVNVPEGWYTVQAQMQNQTILSQSSAFFVQNGTDVSCIPGINTSSMDSNRPKSSSHHLPSHTRHLPLGEVVGIAVGSAAGFTILAMAFAFPQFWRHALTSPKRKHPYHQLF